MSTNSNTLSDRTIESFSLSEEEGVLHAFDLDRKETRPFQNCGQRPSARSC